MVTGISPAFSTAARTIDSSKRGFAGIAAPASSCDFANGAAEIHVDMVDAVLIDEQLGRLGDVVGVDAVELEASGALVGIELRESHGLLVPLDEGPGRDHLGNVETRTETTAKPSEGRVRDARHWGQDDRRVGHNRAERNRCKLAGRGGLHIAVHFADVDRIHGAG